MYKMYSSQMHMSADAWFAPARRVAQNAAACFAVLDAVSLTASFFVTLLAVRIIIFGIP